MLMAEGEAVGRRKMTVRVSGVVQGVGFRPFTAALARRYSLSGYVQNGGGIVVIEAEGPRDALEGFLKELSYNPPRESKIERLEVSWESSSISPSGECPGFLILGSLPVQTGIAMPAPDIAVCLDCLREMNTLGNPRYHNPFISCTLCGPRFSIMERLPYDRENTAMSDFPLCSLCESQYQDPQDRRCHAQTVCCNDCGPRLFYRDQTGEISGQAALDAAISALKQGYIVAIKGIGGYHLACSPFDEAAVSRLRAVKGREGKPFAVMFPCLEEIVRRCRVSPEEKALLSSRERPIVLLEREKSDLCLNVTGSSLRIGAFLPYTPLQALILEQTGPLVMTSANVTSLPIIKDDDGMLRLFGESNGKIGGVLYHNRRILRRLDDSVAEIVDGKPRILRRARGYVPLPVELEASLPDGRVLAFGAQQKNTICLSKGKYFFVSTEIGDLDSEETLEFYRDTIKDMNDLLEIRPQTAACDLHPGYESTRMAKESGLPALQVQHHYAHIASVMAEESLTGKVIGVAFDGTGYGTDITVWGGEFLIAFPDGFERAGYLKPVFLFDSEESIRRGDMTAVCLLLQAGLIPPNDPSVPVLKAALENQIHTVVSSSMGRWFDGVSALLNICRYSDYEGRCAVELENAAAAYARQNALEPEPLPFTLAEENGIFMVDLFPALREIVKRQAAGDPPGLLALRFHKTVSRLVLEMCRLLRKAGGLHEVALSGGVFANRLLLDDVLAVLRKDGFRVYINRQVPPGDGGISLGQAYLCRHRENLPHKEA